MNDPQVVALIYTVEPVKAGRYDNAGPLHYTGSPEFDLTVEDKIARFEFKKFYAYAHEAREAIKPFIQNWQFQAAMGAESDGFTLQYEGAERVDRNPLPPGPRPAPQQVKARVDIEVELSVDAEVTLVSPDYPPPPAGGSVDLDDPAVVEMMSKYEEYCSGRTTLPDAAYFCVTALEKEYRNRTAAAKTCGISETFSAQLVDCRQQKAGRKRAKL